MNVTSKKVAELAGVHPSTVSRAIHDDPRISSKTKEKVFLVIKKVGYTPNALARGLKTKRTNTLGMLIPDITNPFFAEIARGVEDAANKNNFNVILCNTDDSLQKERTYLEILRSKRVDGLILGTAHLQDKGVLKLEKEHFPYILISRNTESLDKNCIAIDDIAGGIMATEYLIKLGHRRIAHITGPLKTRSALDRLKGYKIALAESGIDYREELVERGDFRIKGGYLAMKKLLKLNEPPSAIFAANDLLALGAMQVIQKEGFNIPEDFSLIGFNDIALASFVYPPLTTIHQPMLEMGNFAVKILLNIINNNNQEEIQRKIILSPKLVIRKSCTSFKERKNK